VLVSHTTERERPLRPITGVTHLAAVSEAAAGYFDARPGRRLPVTIIYNGVDEGRCLPQRGRRWQRAQWGVGEQEVAVGYVGRYSVEKNYLAVAYALRCLPQRYRAVYYGAAPDGRVAAELMALARQLAPRLQLFAPQPYLGDVLAGLDVLVLASDREACSLVLLEAWLAGVPVVATPVGSLPELQRRFGTLAVTVPPRPAAEQLAAAIRHAASPAARPIVARAQQIARRHFTAEAMAQRWCCYLEQVVADWQQRATAGAQQKLEIGVLSRNR